MRLLMDEHGIDWEKAWHITQQTCAYTNHTLLVEALERWPLPLFARLLPRHLEIIYEINHRFLDRVRQRYTGDDQLVRRLSLIDETDGKYVRMAHLASVGSHAINGVAALHSELLKRTVLADFHRVAPEKFLNVTNGVTPRRWIALSNPKLSALVTRHIGDKWLADLEHELARLELCPPYKRDPVSSGPAVVPAEDPVLGAVVTASRPLHQGYAPAGTTRRTTSTLVPGAAAAGRSMRALSRLADVAGFWTLDRTTITGRSAVIPERAHDTFRPMIVPFDDLELVYQRLRNWSKDFLRPDRGLGEENANRE
jgi:Carbohydrate phosphorylase